MKNSKSFAAAVTLLAIIATVAWSESGTGTEQQKDSAVERARKSVKMLDDVYKTAIVLITDKYVHDEDDFSAGSAAIEWFDAISKKGWHEVRLLDATGDPYDEKNTARDSFDHEAIKQLKSGKSFYDRIEEKEGKRYLRAATPVPVVMTKCMMCHPHYADAKKGEPIGLLSYTMPIE